MAWQPTMNREKCKQAILFLLNSSANNTMLGKVKLFKLLYYVDFDHYQTFKTPITGNVYRKLPYGPVPTRAAEILEELRAEGLVGISMKLVGDYRQYVFTPKVQGNINTFTTSEMEVLEQVVKKWGSHTTNEIVAATHGEAPWRAVEMGEEIPYSLAFYRRQILEEDGQVDEEIEEIRVA